MRPGGPRWIFLGWLQHLPTSFAYKNRFARISFYKPYITRFMLLSCSRHNRGDEAQQAARLRHRASLGCNAAHRHRGRYATGNADNHSAQWAPSERSERPDLCTQKHYSQRVDSAPRRIGICRSGQGRGPAYNLPVLELNRIARHAALYSSGAECVATNL